MSLNGDFYASGAHRAKFIPLDAAGKPTFTTLNATTPFAGYDFKGLHKWDLPDVANVIITHMDNDAPVVTQTFPPDTMPIAKLTTGINSQSVNAVLQGVKQTTEGEIKMLPYLTDKMGSEPNMALFLYRWAIDNDTRTGVWELALAPRVKVSPKPNSWDRVAQEKTFEVALNKSKKKVWGASFTLADDGCVESALQNGESEYEPALLFWKCDGVEEHFTFKDEAGVAFAAQTTTKITVWDWDTGSKITTGITKTVNDFTLNYSPISGRVLCALIEKAA